MMLLLTHGQPTLRRFNHPNLGRLIQPRHYSSIKATAEEGYTWAADNDAFNDFDPEAFEEMLAAIDGLPGCLFVAAPDVVGDAELTAYQYDEWAWKIHRYGQQPALVLQDGLTDPGDVPWGTLGAVFIGGTDDYKLSEPVVPVIEEAKRRGKWVHMGRVNSLRRLRYAASIGCDSIDGTKYSRFVDTWLAEGLAHMQGGRQGRLVR